MRKIFLALLLLIACKSFSQTRTLDSLKKLIDSDKKDDSVKVKRLYEYGRQLFRAASLSPQPDYSKSIHYTRESIQLANKIDRPDLASKSYLMVGELIAKIMYRIVRYRRY